MSDQLGSVPIQEFETFYRSALDPYDMNTRWYERRKRAVTVAALPREHYSLGLELACGEGALTKLLAPRCAGLVATEGSTTALDRARVALAPTPNVELVHHVLPASPPAGPYDLIVISEIGYFLDAVDLERTRDYAVRELTSDGDLVAIHWRHPSADYPLDGAKVHAVLGASIELLPLIQHEDEDFILTVWRKR